MKATLVAFLLVGALCVASTFAEGNRKLEVSEQGDDGDKALEKVFMKLLAKMQEDGAEEEEDDLAEMQDDDENKEDALEQDVNKAVEQLSITKPYSNFKLKILGNQLITFGGKAVTLGKNLLIFSKTLRSISSSLSSHGLKLKQLGLTLTALGRKLVYIRE